ncbi:hypothetical protein Tco_1216862 [Tanacetum coccineum]
MIVELEMKDTEVPKTRKCKKEISDAAKADAEKTGEVKDDQVKNDSTQDNQATVFASTPQQHQLPQKFLIYSQQSFKEYLNWKKSAVDKYLGSTLGDTLQKNSALFQTMTKSKSFNKHPAHKALYHALMESLLMDEEGIDQRVVDLLKHKKRQHDDQDEDPSARPNQGKKTKRRRTKESESSKKSSVSKDAVNDIVVNDADQPQNKSEPKTTRASRNDWFTQPPRPPTLDPEWNKGKEVDDGQEQTWFNDLLSVEKVPITFEELMATPIDFSNFAMNRLKIDKLTKENLPEGDHCPFDLSKPLPLKGCPGHLTTNAARYELMGIKDMIPNIWSVTKVGYDKDALQGIKNWGPKRKVFYRSQLNRFSRHDVYSSMKILSVKSVTVNKLHGYGYLEEIVVRRDDRQLYKFKEGDFVNLHLNDIEDMLFLVVQHKLFHLNGEVIVDLAVALRMFTRSLIIKKRVEDVQLGVESYQKKLNITKPQKDFPRISAKELYTPSFDPPEAVYADLSNRKRIMRVD